MALSPAQLRWLFGPAGPFHRKPGAEQKAREHGLVEGNPNTIVSDKGARVAIRPADPEAFRAKLNADPGMQNIGKPSPVIHPGEREAWRERVPFHSLHMIRNDSNGGGLYRGHVDRANPRQGVVPAIVHAGDVAVDAAPVIVPGAVGAGLLRSRQRDARARQEAADLLRAARASKRESRAEKTSSDFGERDAVGHAAGKPVKAVKVSEATHELATGRHKTAQFRFLDEQGNVVGGVGVTVDPKGRAWVGGVSHNRLFVRGGVKPSVMKDLTEQMGEQLPEAKAFVGLHAGPARRLTRDLRALHAKWAGRQARVVAFSKKSPAHAAAAAAAVPAAKLQFFREMRDLPKGKLHEVLVNGAKRPPAYDGVNVVAYKGMRSGPLVGQGQMKRIMRLKGAAGLGLMALGAAAYYRKRHRQGTVAG